MLLTIQRTKITPDKTFGKLLKDGHFVCFTLEDTVRQVDGQPVKAWKVHGKTAIPTGDYRLALENSPRFGPETLTICNVDGFTGVRMHAGNTEHDTEGCPLLGMAIDDNGIVGGTSRPAVDAVKRIVKEARRAGANLRIDIKNPVEVAA